jgi:hypothetical protein
MAKSPKRIILERVKKLGKLRKELLRRTQSAVSLLGKSTLQRKLAQRNSVTSVRNMEELIQPIILGIVRSLMRVELSKQDSNLGRKESSGLVVEPVLNGAVDPGSRPRLRSKCRRTWV